MGRTVIVGVCFILSACNSEPTCSNQMLDRLISPDGKRAAVIFSRNCGATVSDNYQVSIVPSGETPDGKGNVLIVDHSPPYSDKYRPSWNKSDYITVPIPDGSRVFLKNTNANDVVVKFQQM